MLALAESERPLVGPAEQGGVIDPDVLWSCTTCGACVEQCPVDIEHVDHIVDMRRYQVMIESEFPSELGGLFRNLETKGNPWGMNASARLDWAADLPFEVRVVTWSPRWSSIRRFSPRAGTSRRPGSRSRSWPSTPRGGWSRIRSAPPSGPTPAWLPWAPPMARSARSSPGARSPA